MKKRLIIKINHFIFKWYYKRVSAFYRKFTFIKSVKMLIDNYETQKETLELNGDRISGMLIKNNKQYNEIRDLKIKIKNYETSKI